MWLFSKTKCYICRQKDFKAKMSCLGYYGNDKYFHPSCVKEVICDYRLHDSREVDRALWIHELLIEEKESRAKEIEKRKKRLKEAQSTICN